MRHECQLMLEAMIKEGGVGLAAPQIGISKRIIVLDVDGVFHVVLNPRIEERSEELEESSEGCLSVPGVSAPVARSARVRLRGTDLDGKPVEIAGEGLLARAIQHEMDHLDGMLFLDHLSTVRRQSLLKEYRRQGQESS